MSTTNELASKSGRDRPRFGLPQLGLTAAGVGVYVALVAVAIQNQPRVLDVLMEAPGFFALGWGCLAIGGLLMMAVHIARGSVGRNGTIALLLAGVLYGAVNVGFFLVSFSTDEFAIFERAYTTRVLAAPALMMVAALIAAGVTKRFDWLGVLGFVCWIGSVGLAHLWVIAAASASV